MSQPYITDISQEQSDAIFGQIAELAAKTFRNMDLSMELVEAAQMQLLKKSMPHDPAEITEEFIETTLFPRAVDTVFGGFQRDCFRFCLSKSKDTNLSEDIAQEAIKSLLLSENKVESVGPWLIQVTYNLLCAHYRESEREKQLYEQLSLEAATFEKWMASDDPLELRELSPAMVDEILKTDEYLQYDELMSFKTLKDFADAHAISEKVAQKRKEKIIRNLKSMIMLGLGWHDTPVILDYNQYNAIRKFMREVLKMLSGDEEIEWLKALTPEQIEILKQVKILADWTISMVKKHKYMLLFFTILDDGKPFLMTFDIVMDERNSISIQNFRINKHLASYTAPPNLRIPMEKGRAIWSFKQIISLLDKQRLR